MKRMLKTRNTIVIFLASLLCFVAGLFFIETNESSAITASADNNYIIGDLEITTETIDGFEMVPGAALRSVPGEQYLRLKVNLTDEMVENLTKPTVKQNLWDRLFGEYKEKYVANDYYLILIKDPPEDANGILGWTRFEYFHIDPKHSELKASELVLNGNEAQLKIAFTEMFDWEHTYYCVYGKLEKDAKASPYNLGGVQSIARAQGEVTRSVQYIARKVLENEAEFYDDETLEWFNYLAGYEVPEDVFRVNFSYQNVDQNGFIQWYGASINYSSILRGASEILLNDLMNKLGYITFSDFDVKLKNPDGTSQTVLKANDYIYEYDNETGEGNLRITYSSFEYSNYHLRIQDYNLDKNIDLYYHLPATSISADAINRRYILHYNFDEIKNKCFRELGWVFNLAKENFNLWNESENVYFEMTDTELKIMVPQNFQDELQYFFAMAMVEIVLDHECNVELEYTSLAFENGTIAEELTVDSVGMLYSEWVNLNSYTTFQGSRLYNVVSDALALPILEGKKYFTPNGIEGNYNKSDGTLTLKVLYQYNTLLQISDDKGNIHFVECNSNEREYKISKLCIAPMQGQRIQKLTSTSSDVEIVFNEEMANNLSVTVRGDLQEKKIIPLEVTYSNVWSLDIVYMTPYKDTPFAEKKVYSTTIQVGEYDVKALTLSDIKEILGRTDDMRVCGLSLPNKTVTSELTSESTYTAILTYGLTSATIEYNGNKDGLRIPLTSFADFCEMYGADLTIKSLNKENKEYFKDNNEIERDKLYGFFSAVVFSEKVSDFNYWFEENIESGTLVIYERRSVQGSKLYKYFEGKKDSLVGTRASIGMALCEVFNDDNQTLNTVFFYMDETSGTSSNGGKPDNSGGDTDDKANPQREKSSSWIIAAFGVIGMAEVIFVACWLVKNSSKKKAGERKTKKSVSKNRRKK